MKNFDAIVIGAGQAGPPLAGRLTHAGMSVALIERHLFGGTCVNTGCMPTKTLVASAHAAHVARRAADYGVVLSGPVGIDMKRVKARADKVSSDARTGVETWLRGMDDLHGAARPCALHRAANRGGRRRNARRAADLHQCRRTRVRARYAGPRDIPFLTNTSMLALDHLPEHLVIIGGSYIGLEFAQMYRRFGAQVTVIERANG